MKNLFHKIELIQLIITDECSDDQKKLIKDYWAYNEFTYQFDKLPSLIRMQYGISQKELNNTVATYSKMSLYLHCNTCNSMESNTFTSQSDFRLTIAELKRLGTKDYKCKECRYSEREKIKNEKELAAKEHHIEEYERAFIKAENIKKSVANKRWETLTEFENMVLENAIIINDIEGLKAYYYGMGGHHYKMLFPTLRMLDAEHLLYLKYDVWDKSRIESYEILNDLRTAYPLQSKGNKTINPAIISNITPQDNIIALSLGAPLEQGHPDSPLLSAKFNPREDIILESGKEYLCNLYSTSVGNVSITINPVKKEKELPDEIRLDELPIELRKKIEDHLRYVDKNWTRE